MGHLGSVYGHLVAIVDLQGDSSVVLLEKVAKQVPTALSSFRMLECMIKLHVNIDFVRLLFGKLDDESGTADEILLWYGV